MSQESTELSQGLWVAHLSLPRAWWVTPSLISVIVSAPVWQENIQKVPLTCGMQCDTRQALIIQHSPVDIPVWSQTAANRFSWGVFVGENCAVSSSVPNPSLNITQVWEKAINGYFDAHRPMFKWTVISHSASDLAGPSVVRWSWVLVSSVGDFVSHLCHCSFVFL